MEGETSADMSVPDEPLNAAKLLPDQRLLQQLLEVIREGDDHIAFELADAIETVADGEDFVQAHIYQARAFLYARCGASAERDFWKAAALATIDTVCEKGNAIDSKWMDSLRQYVVRNVPARQPDQHGAIDYGIAELSLQTHVGTEGETTESDILIEASASTEPAAEPSRDLTSLATGIKRLGSAVTDLSLDDDEMEQRAGAPDTTQPAIASKASEQSSLSSLDPFKLPVGIKRQGSDVTDRTDMPALSQTSTDVADTPSTVVDDTLSAADPESPTTKYWRTADSTRFGTSFFDDSGDSPKRKTRY